MRKLRNVKSNLTSKFPKKFCNFRFVFILLRTIHVLIEIKWINKTISALIHFKVNFIHNLLFKFVQGMSRGHSWWPSINIFLNFVIHNLRCQKFNEILLTRRRRDFHSHKVFKCFYLLIIWENLKRIKYCKLVVYEDKLPVCLINYIIQTLQTHMKIALTPFKVLSTQVLCQYFIGYLKL